MQFYVKLSVEESRCCKEIDVVQQEMGGARTTYCMVDHPGFEPCCLDPYVLRTANYAFIDHHGHRRPLQANQHHRPLGIFVQNVCHLTFPLVNYFYNSRDKLRMF